MVDWNGIDNAVLASDCCCGCTCGVLWVILVSPDDEVKTVGSFQYNHVVVQQRWTNKRTSTTQQSDNKEDVVRGEIEFFLIFIFPCCDWLGDNRSPILRGASLDTNGIIVFLVKGQVLLTLSLLCSNEKQEQLVLYSLVWLFVVGA